MKIFTISSGGLQRAILLLSMLLTGLGLSGTASAQLIFSFQEVNGDVTMMPAGSIDTSLLQSSSHYGWGGQGVEPNTAPESDIMGDTTQGDTDTGFGFSQGTDFSAWVNDPGPFTQEFFGWSGAVTTPFSTYINPAGREPGLQVRSSDLVNGVFTPIGSWTATTETFASLGLTPGIHTVTDARTGASITYLIGEGVIPPATTPALPVPTLSTWALALLVVMMGWIGYRRRRIRV